MNTKQTKTPRVKIERKPRKEKTPVVKEYKKRGPKPGSKRKPKAVDLPVLVPEVKAKVRTHREKSRPFITSLHSTVENVAMSVKHYDIGVNTTAELRASLLKFREYLIDDIDSVIELLG